MRRLQTLVNEVIISSEGHAGLDLLGGLFQILNLKEMGSSFTSKFSRYANMF